ncbi:hypothetical protein F4679DRAFT_401148 [Xylaria curta]|nr:hypothetical protein F4679DRAFT_401148 [Xylaria curta]
MLHTLVLGGEAIQANDVRKWAPHVNHLLAAYGVSECAVVNMVRRCSADDDVEQLEHANLGHAVGVTCWVADQQDTSRLVAPGEVGELWLDGPSVGRGYLDDKVLTAQAFVDPPSWHPHFHIHPNGGGDRRKLYRTGDLVRANPEDGSLRYAGRKDDQVKLHGQRLQVQEVEHFLRRALPAARGLVVGVVAIDTVETLVAFIVPDLQNGAQQHGHDYSNSSGHSFFVPNDEFREAVKLAQQRLSADLPRWMIPTMFLPLQSIPLTSSGKSDRRRLCAMAGDLTPSKLRSYAACLPSVGKRQPLTAVARAIQSLWAEILRLEPREIGLDDSFFELGGDSVGVMKLAGAIRRRGLDLAVRLIYDKHTLEDMASSVGTCAVEMPQPVSPFSLVPAVKDDHDTLRTTIAQQCHLEHGDEIEDVYPCTPLQEGLFSHTLKKPGSYTVVFEYTLPPHLDVRQFQDAWHAVTAANPILRTRVVQVNGSLYQAVVRSPLTWETVQAGIWGDWELGRRLARLCLSSHESRSGGSRLVFTFALHHALADGWSLPLLLQQVQNAYDGAELVPRPFSPFIDHIIRTRSESEKFWSGRFKNIESATFPAVSSASYIPNPTAMKTMEIPIHAGQTYEFAAPNRLKLAWSILISLYTDNPDTLFGITVSGRGASVLGIEEVTGPTIATVPCCLTVPPAMTVAEALRMVQQDYIDTMPFEQIGLQHIARLRTAAASACQFQSLLVIQPEAMPPPALFCDPRDLAAQNAFSTYAINLFCRQMPSSLSIEATFDPEVISEIQLNRMLFQLKHIFQQLVPSMKDLPLGELDTTSLEDWSELRKWNENLPDPFQACAHDLIRKHLDSDPNAPAVRAWDGSFTRGELDNLSSSLAMHLMELGVGPEVFIPLCFEKSGWTTVAMLAVLKAGGAFVLLDPDHPVQRLHSICRDAEAPLILSSKLHSRVARELAPRLVVVGLDWKASDTSTDPTPPVSNPLSSPTSSMYAVFTSGSTGTPKGAVHSHTSWCTSAIANQTALYLGVDSRVFQFARYAFDISIADSLLTLVAGGCVCVPSDDDIRGGGLTDSINRLGANWACLTPSVARTIEPAKVPALRTLVLCGEPIASEVITKWAPHAHLLNEYGPAECAILTTVHREVRDSSDPNNIGFPTSAVTWVVNTKNEKCLAPIGTVGELYVESPIVGHGYLNNPDHTLMSFVKGDNRPPWLSSFRPVSSSRLYRTGDLVRYTDDGALRYVTRKDTQVKLRGQRIELGEVEYHLRRSFPQAEQAVAEVVTPKDTRRPALVAFIILSQQMFKVSDSRFKALSAEALERLHALLPVYMVPTMFIQVNHFPYSKSGKLDRRQLRTMASDMPSDEYDTPSNSTMKVMPASSEERSVRQLFADALKMTVDEIGCDDNFFRLGGDSILAMGMVAMAKERGIAFNMADVFRYPSVSSLAKMTSRPTSNKTQSTKPMYTLGKDADQSQVLMDAARQCEVHPDMVEDVYPSTPLQEGLMALAVKTPGMYVSRYKYEVSLTTDITLFKEAWNAVSAANPILRTRMIQVENGGIFQVVLKHSTQFEMHDTLDDQLRHSKAHLMALGSPLFHLSLAPLSVDSGNHYLFIFTIHHSLYDGWSLSLLWDQVCKAYRGDILVARPFSSFIHHITEIQGGGDYWRQRFDGIEAAIFPPLPSANLVPMPNRSFNQSISSPINYKGDQTMSTMIQFAWAVVQSHYTDTADVVFGLTSNGRGAEMEGIAGITGPTIATVPVRVSLDADKTVEKSIATLQQQTVASIPFLHHGLRQIRKISADASSACDFQTHLVVQPTCVTAPLDLGGLAVAEPKDYSHGYVDFASYALVIAFHLQEDSNRIEVSVNFDPNVLSETEARRLIEQFQAVLHRLATRPKAHVADIEVVSEQDMLLLKEWNDLIPTPIPIALHDLVLRHCTKHSSSMAVCAWDGKLTYEDLDDWSSSLAGHLLGLGIQTESRVAVCLEKSKWSIVALIGILRAGCACVLLDPGHPRNRIQEMIAQTTPQLIVVSETHAHLIHGLSESATVLISADFIQQLPPSTTQSLPVVEPHHAAFILFTSGSTGKPKGIIMEHGNLSTSIASHEGVMNANLNSRSLHFASYSFDMSIYEIFDTLCFGGCLYIPSKEDRLNRLGAFIRENEINWAVLTPSTLNILQPEEVPSLKTLVVGGEAVSRNQVDRWANKVTLINGYGPAEATICTLGVIQPSQWKIGTMGHMVGSVGWIVDASSTSKLAAIGAVGELVIEGPVVTRGYLNEPEKTAANYIEPPAWLRKFRSNGITGRLYKSGDLVQYNTDGAIRFVGRKDTQVKLRGQRIELSEVEYHVKTCFASAAKAEAVADVITPKLGRTASLVAFICLGVAPESRLPGNDGGIFLEPTESFRERARDARAALSASVPPFMVPEFFLPLRSLPLTRSGKADRKRLREAYISLSLEQMQSYSAEVKSVKRAPSTDTERALQDVWARVLKMDATTIGMDDDFFHLHGDSISAMQVVTQCAKVGLKISVSALFQAKTVSRLAVRAEKMQYARSFAIEEPNTKFTLSPAQMMFFEAADRDYNHFNQNLTCRIRLPITAQKLKQALLWTVKNHPMLRARFFRDSNGQWGQVISSDVVTCFDFVEKTVASIDDAKSLIQCGQKCLNIQKGPVFICQLIHVGQDLQPYISFTAHHLVTDTLSWKVLLSNIEELLISEREPLEPSISFQTWVRLQTEYAVTKSHSSKILPEYQFKDMSTYWGINREDNTYGNVSESRFFLSKEQTQAFLGNANKAFRTTPVEILHAAFLQAFVATFRDRAPPTTHCQGHGRDPWDPSIDLTRTIGCLTTIWPVQIPVEPSDTIFEIVRKTKDTQRIVNLQRWSYFTSCYTNYEGIARSRGTTPFEILFNYGPGLTESKGSVLQICPLLEGELAQMSPKMLRFALVDIRAEIKDSQLSVNFVFNNAMRRQDISILDWIDKTRACLNCAVSTLAQHKPTFTSSDLPMLSYSPAEFDDFNRTVVSALNSRALEIEDAYPCSPIQEGMMLSQAKNPGQYVNRLVWTAKLQSGPVDVERLKNAWYQVLQKHPLLRTVSYERPDRSGRHDQLVLRGPLPSICTILETRDGPREFLTSYEFEIPPLTPQHRIAICSSPSGDVACLLQISHAIIDGISCQLLLRDLRLAYDGKLGTAPSQAYRAYIEHLGKLPLLDDSLAHFEKYLASAEACILHSTPALDISKKVEPARQLMHKTFPLHEKLQNFCTQYKSTIANVFQVAWAMVLRVYLGMNEVCFGHILSGRGMPIAGIENAIGPFINLLICHMVIEGDEVVLNLLQRNRDEFAQNLEFQHVSLGDQIKAAKRSEATLFNTAMSVLKEIEVDSMGSTLQFQDLGGSNPTEYDLVVYISLLKNSTDISWGYSRDFISDEQVQNIADAFEQTLLSIMANPRQNVSSVSLLGQVSKGRLVEYNQKEAPAIDEYVDKLVEKRCFLQPSALAVDAWDGSFTYGEVNALSSRVAAHLVNRGLKSNHYVPLLFERTRWTPIAILGVLKAGAAFMLLDISHPFERIRTSCQKVGATVILTSKSNKTIASSLADEIFVLDEHIVDEEAQEFISNNRNRDLGDAAYAVFTSGSSGEPKGITITHINLATSTIAHGNALRIGTDSRVLQFSSYAFDPAILDHVTTLVMGGCICIPSDTARHNIAGSAAVLKANWVALTPSVARILNPSEFETIRTLIIGGEPITAKELNVWRSHVDIYCVYGPSECSIVTSTRPVTEGSVDGLNLGLCVGSTGWVVSPEDPSQLLPVGAIGELVIEGPIVGREYIGLPDKTAAAWLMPPEWLIKFRGKSTGRLYRTGDLVRYIDNGELQFVGRKDSQVKVRGNRIELSEVETHLRACLHDAVDVAVDVITPVGDNAQPMLVAFVCQDASASHENDKSPVRSVSLLRKPSHLFSQWTQDAESQIAKSLPGYMIPAVFFPLSHMPLTKTGKLDREKLRVTASGLTLDELGQFMVFDAERQMPSTELEVLLQDVWARVLHKEKSSIGIHDNFFRFGGDSIGAMQVASQCSALGLKISVPDILRNKSISQLAANICGRQTGAIELPQVKTGSIFDLSPIQNIYFEAAPLANHHFNQSQFLQLTRAVTLGSLKAAIDCLTQLHSMLRARFLRNQQGKWMQTILANTSGSYSCQKYSISSLGTVGDIISASQEVTDAQNGPMLVASLINTEDDGQYYLFIAIHHLVVDIVSWQVILPDLEEFLTNGFMSRKPPLSFQSWCDMQREYASKNLDPDHARLDFKIPNPPNDYWAIEGKSNLVKDETQVSFSLDESTTSLLLGLANRAFDTQPVELLQAALLYSFAHTFRDRPPSALWVEGHGREPWSADIDLSSTVGWFTTIWPLFIAIDGGDICDVIRKTKDIRRSVPMNGWAHFASSLHHKAQKSISNSLTEVTFNYVSRIQQSGSTNSLFRPVPLDLELPALDTSGELRRSSIIDVVAGITGNRLSFQFIFNRHTSRHRQILDWVKMCRTSLDKMAADLPTMTKSLTLSDFPLVPFTYESLETFLNRCRETHGIAIDNIEDIYPCSPIQRGILLSQAKSTDHYQTFIIWKMHANDGVKIDMARVQAVWESIITRHSIFRTVFVQNTGSDSLVLQVVLKSVPAAVTVLPTDEEIRLLSTLENHRKALTNDEGMPYRLRLGMTSAGDVLLGLEVSHAIVDGATRHNLQDELTLLYTTADSPGQVSKFAYRDYISYLHDRSPVPIKEYWTGYLRGVVPCHFPQMTTDNMKPVPNTLGSINVELGDASALRQFCTQREVTLLNLFQVSWGMVLKSYVNTNDVCFGYLSAGRDIPIPHIQGAIGPFINLLACRLNLDDSDSIISTLQANQSSIVESMEHQHLSLTDMLAVAQLPGGRALFNTVMSLQHDRTASAHMSTAVSFDVIGGKDPSEYDIVIHISVGPERIDMMMEYWHSSMSDEMAIGVADCFLQTVDQMIADCTSSVGSLPVLGDASREMLHRWSGTLPEPELGLVHELIHQRCLAQPDTIAVDSWDGKFTYHEVDQLSTQLALHLAQQGCGDPDTFIPICSEKSRWTTIVMLAVLKTGSAFILLDPSQPPQRLQEICDIAQAKLIVTSEEQAHLASTLAHHAVTVGDQHQSWAEATSKPLSNTATPDNILYAVFTSGSTGKPKGVMIEHRAYVTSVREHRVALAINRDSRVLQFASYAFDASIAEHLTTLLIGGCICVASDTERKQSLAQAVARMQVNWMFMTPSVIRTLRPEDFPSVKTLICGGELISDRELSIWRDKVDMYLAYGPTEFTYICSSTIRVTAEISSGGRNLGKSFGCRSWIVDRNDHAKLVPVGAVGELVLEGPTAARGYLNEPAKTAAVFIQPPAWFRAFGDAPSKLYKTGDLVKYNADGTLHYVSRKDTQVKVRGQRMELGEVEHHLRQCYPTATDAAVELVEFEDGSRQSLLVAFIWTKDRDAAEAQVILAQPTPEFRSQAQSAEANLNELLPSYMVPTLYLPLQRLPLNINGKANRPLLRQCVTALSQKEISAYSAPPVAKRPASTDTERMLQAIWARVLNIAPEQIGMQDSFFRLGGDSISAMQIVSFCARQHLDVKIADIFRYGTISEIGKRTTASKVSAYNSEAKTDTLFALSPIQQMFFAAAPNGVNHFNQSFFFRVNTPVAAADLFQATTTLVTRHHMLRARFRKSEIDSNAKHWEQLILREVEGSFRFGDHQITSLEDSRDIVLAAQTSLHFESGPVFAVELMATGSGEQYLFVVAHHLVVDLVSWRIIVQDLADLLTTPGTALSQKSIPFQTWVSLQAEYAAKHLNPERVITGDIPPPMLEYWGMSDKRNLVKDAGYMVFSLSEDMTQALLGPANEAFQTQPVELFQAALLQSFMRTFDDREEAPTIFSEGHGREPWNPTIDVTNTVGWFTTMSPTHIQSRDLLDIVRRTKDQRRQLCDNGWAYFTSRYLNPLGRDRLRVSGLVEIVFNFTGQFQQFERKGTLFSPVEDFQHGVSDAADGSPRFAIFDVAATISKNRLQFSFVYNHHAADTRPVDPWIANYEKSLSELATILPSHPRTATLVDYPRMSLDYPMLDALVQNILPEYGVSASEVEDIYPCSPIQNGMLLSQSKATLVYDNRFILKVSSTSETGVISTASFITAWNQVVKRHSILRTFFIPSQNSGGYKDQVVLKNIPQDTVTTLPPNSNPQQALDKCGSVTPTKSPAPLHLTLCSESETATDELYCVIEINHALIDGASLQVLVRDLQRAYDNTLPSAPALLYSDYVGYIQSLSTDTAKGYWQQYLKGSDPCLFPTTSANMEQGDARTVKAATANLVISSQLSEFCEAHGLTLSNIFHLAWSLVLRAYTGSNDVCFGSLTSGRDIPVPGIEDACGPFINLLVCRTKFSEDLSLGQLLERTQTDYLNNTEHQHLPLVEIKRSLNLSGIPLFNTILSMQREGMATESGEDSSVRFEPLKSENPTEYDITLNIWATGSGIEIVLHYWNTSMSEFQAKYVIDTLEKAVSEITSKVEQRVSDLDLFGEQSRAQVLGWNRHAPERVSKCAHELIKERNAHRPEATAVCAWDGDFTYADLDEKATRLAMHLVQTYDIHPGIFVPVYFEKSKWTAVAVLGILKAGGAFVLMDPSHPIHRLRGICDDSQAPLIITSSSRAAVASGLCRHVLAIGDDQFDWATELTPFQCTITPDDPI